MPKFWGTKEEEDEGIEFKPDVFKSEITGSVNTKIDELKTEFTPVLDFVKNFQAEQTRRTEEERTRRENEQHKVGENEFILNPENATRKLLQPLAQEQLKLAARMAKQDALADKEYYTGEIKDKVDALLAAQPLENQSNPSVINNTYKIVAFDYRKDIDEGKIKNRFAATQFGSNGTGGHSSDDNSGQNSDVMTNEEKQYAAKLGISEKEWVASRKELEYV